MQPASAPTDIRRVPSTLFVRSSPVVTDASQNKNIL